jgi:hypothetical protein
MRALQELIDFCAAEQGRRDVLTVPLSLVRLMGSPEGGLFLAQLLAWMEREGDGDGWVARSYAEWAAATALPASRVRALTRQCRALGFLEVRAGPFDRPFGSARGNFRGEAERRYRLLQAPLFRALAAFLRGEPVGPYVPRKPARRKMRLPVQGVPADWREGPAQPPARKRDERLQRAARPEALALHATIAAPAVEWAAASLNGNGHHRPNGDGKRAAARPGRPGVKAARRGQAHPAGPSAPHRGTSGQVPFEAHHWDAALREVSRKVPPAVYARWLAGSEFAAVEGSKVLITVGDMNAAWWVNTRLARQLERAVNLVAPGKRWLEVEARAA